MNVKRLSAEEREAYTNAVKVVERIAALVENKPESMLMFEVFRQTIDDLFHPYPRKQIIFKTKQAANEYAKKCNEISDIRASAQRHLNGDMIELMLIGIDPDYVRRLLKSCGILLKSKNHTMH